jgi:CheY-like chemotaxis protein
MSATGPLILCVDDEPAVLEGLKLTLRKFFDVATTTSGVEGFAVLKQKGGAAARHLTRTRNYCWVKSLSLPTLLEKRVRIERAGPMTTGRDSSHQKRA